MNLCYVRHRLFEGVEWRRSAMVLPVNFVSQQKPPRLVTGEPTTTTTASTSEAGRPQHHITPKPSPVNPPTRPSTTPDIPANPPSPPTPSSHPAKPPPNMAEAELFDLVKQLHQTLTSRNPSAATALLSRAKLHLLQLNALIPSPRTTPQAHLLAAREVLELGALLSIRLADPESFTRYFQQLQPFYALPAAALPRDRANASKITGLYLLLLLSQGDYAGFHTLLETLELSALEAAGAETDDARGLDEDEFIQYPIRLEQALMEGSYDRVWGETKRERVPSPEFGVFSEVLIGTIRSEIASCSEKAYPSIPISDAKSLLFLESEGSVVEFARKRGWRVRDGRLYFPVQQQDMAETQKDILAISGQVIENTIGYARELETIV